MLKSYIGYSKNKKIRFEATSGGVGSSILKFLFEKNYIQTSISFVYDTEKLQYVPELIYDYNEYRVSGSIYHEIDLVRFIKQNISKIRGCFACFALPCQARAIKSIVEKRGHRCFILGLTCSSQQSFEATKYLLRRLYLKEEDVLDIKYRGNGWPSGIQITLRSQKSYFISNNASLWTEIFHSRIFIKKRCFKCLDTLNENSDITLADPWLEDFVDTEKIGKTLIAVNTLEGDLILNKAHDAEYIFMLPFDCGNVFKSQNITIKRKESYRKHPRLISYIVRVIQAPLYFKIIKASPILFQLHCRLRRSIESFIVNY